MAKKTDAQLEKLIVDLQNTKNQLSEALNKVDIMMAHKCGLQDRITGVKITENPFEGRKAQSWEIGWREADLDIRLTSDRTDMLNMIFKLKDIVRRDIKKSYKSEPASNLERESSVAEAEALIKKVNGNGLERQP